MADEARSENVSNVDPIERLLEAGREERDVEHLVTILGLAR